MNSVEVTERYALVDAETQIPWLYAKEAHGLFLSRENGHRKVGFSGLRFATADGKLAAIPDEVAIAFLDSGGNVIGRYDLYDFSLQEAGDHVKCDERVELQVTFYCDDLLPGAEPIWDAVRNGRLTMTGLWHGLGASEMHAWLSVALNRHPFTYTSDAPSGVVYHVDGRNIKCEQSFYCAIGESVNGPGGYFGWNLPALDDCLRGNWGATAPFTIAWHHADDSMARLSSDVDNEKNYEGRFVEYLTEVLVGHGVNIILE
ncbi:hypothetical protein GCM10010271_67660 [Streptomyces kurssanovii]|nr:hypothetical protein GCM10010271_67660 [Streptomyces kurssanovii]